MLKNKLNRRYFIKKMLLAGAGSSLLPWLQNCAPKPKKGEEWAAIKNQNTGPLHQPEVMAQAQEGIAAYRQAVGIVQLQLPDGTPMRHTQVTVTQQNQPFDFGISNLGSILTHDTEGNLPFNCSTAKCYWDEGWHQPIEQTRGQRIYTLFDEELQQAQRHNMRIKGHPLVWMVPKALPDWWEALPLSKKMAELEKHVRQLVRYGGTRVTHWDLCNEMLWEPTPNTISQRQWPHITPINKMADYIAPALDWARAENPNAVYSLNDYGLFALGQSDITPQQQRNRYIALATELHKRNATPDALGLQSHIGGWYPDAVFKNALDHMATAGLPLQITEFWAHPSDNPNAHSQTPQQQQQAQAEHVVRMATIAFGHKAVTHFTVWDNNTVLLKTPQGHKLTPAYFALKNLINNTFTTKLTLKTDEQGKVQFKGFKGDYVARAGQVEKHFTVGLPKLTVSP